MILNPESWVVLQINMATKAAPVEKTQGGPRTALTDEQIAYVKAQLLELVPERTILSS